MTTNLRDLALKPRCVALLVILREGPLSTRSIKQAINDRATTDTRALLRDAHDFSPGRSLVMEYPPEYSDETGLSNLDLWGLTHDGLGWLQLNGLDASPTAKQALYDATDAQAVRS